MLTKTYQDNVSTMTQSDFALTEAAKALIPANYELAPGAPTIVNGQYRRGFPRPGREVLEHDDVRRVLGLILRPEY